MNYIYFIESSHMKLRGIKISVDNSKNSKCTRISIKLIKYAKLIDLLWPSKVLEVIYQNLTMLIVWALYNICLLSEIPGQEGNF